MTGPLSHERIREIFATSSGCDTEAVEAYYMARELLDLRRVYREAVKVVECNECTRSLEAMVELASESTLPVTS